MQGDSVYSTLCFLAFFVEKVINDSNEKLEKEQGDKDVY